MSKKKATKPAKKVDPREDVVNLIGKIKSEGMHYFFTGYASAASIKEMYPSAPQSFIDAAQKFEDASGDLEAEIQLLQDKYEIDPEEVEY